MVKVPGPLFSFFARGWLGKDTYKRRGVVPNPYPISFFGVNPPLCFATSVYYSRKGWCYQTRRTWHGLQPTAILPPISAQPKTLAQEAWKQVFADAVGIWQGMSEKTRDIYRAHRYPVVASGYNRFIRLYLRKMR